MLFGLQSEEKYGVHRISPVTQMYDDEFYKSFYSKGDGNIYLPLPGGDDASTEDPDQA